MRLTFALCALLVAAGCSEKNPVATGPIEPDCRIPAPLYIPSNAERIPDHYIVVYYDDVVRADSVSVALAAKYRFTPTYVWSGRGLRGFAATLNPAALAGIRCEASVNYVEQDQIIHLD